MKIKQIEKVVNYLENHTWKETATHFKISEMTISRYIKKHRLTNIIKDDKYINLLKSGFNKLLRKKLLDMKTSELRLVYYLLTDKSVSLRKEQYISKIMKITGTEKWKTI